MSLSLSVAQLQREHVVMELECIDRLYLNGKLIAEQPDCRSDLTPTTLPLRLGADADGGSLFNGMISEVRLWQRTLGSEEIASLNETK